MLDDSARGEVNIARLAGEWIRESRARFGWSEQDLADRVGELRQHIFAGPRITAEHVIEVETEPLRYVPAWVRYACMAFELGEIVTDEDYERWRQLRTWRRQDFERWHPVDISWPAINRYDALVLEQLDHFSDFERALIRRMLRAYHDGHPENSRKVLSDLIAAFEQKTGKRYSRGARQDRLESFARLEDRRQRDLLGLTAQELHMIDVVRSCSPEAQEAIMDAAYSASGSDMGETGSKTTPSPT